MLNGGGNRVLDDYLKNYKSGTYKTVKEIFEDVVTDIINEIDNELYDLENDITTLSNKETTDRIRDLREKIY